jgi:hypothetical protein
LSFLLDRRNVGGIANTGQPMAALLPLLLLIYQPRLTIQDDLPSETPLICNSLRTSGFDLAEFFESFNRRSTCVHRDKAFL